MAISYNKISLRAFKESREQGATEDKITEPAVGGETYWWTKNYLERAGWPEYVKAFDFLCRTQIFKENRRPWRPMKDFEYLSSRSRWKTQTFVAVDSRTCRRENGQQVLWNAPRFDSATLQVWAWQARVRKIILGHLWQLMIGMSTNVENHCSNEFASTMSLAYIFLPFPLIVSTLQRCLVAYPHVVWRL